jgi:hypothetical protein
LGDAGEHRKRPDDLLALSHRNGMHSGEPAIVRVWKKNLAAATATTQGTAA